MGQIYKTQRYLCALSLCFLSNMDDKCVENFYMHGRWDDRTSAVIPDEDIFYTVGLLHSSGTDDWEAFENQNKEIQQFCSKAGIKIKLYLHGYKTKEDWMNHFGPTKWKIFKEMKAQFDPKLILSPGQQIFNSV